MKKLEIKETKLIEKVKLGADGVPELDDGKAVVEKYTNYLFFINLALNTIPEHGLTPSEMRKRLKVAEKLDGLNVDDLLLLEDNEASDLKGWVRQIKWKQVHEDILAFCDAVENMEPAKAVKEVVVKD